MRASTMRLFFPALLVAFSNTVSLAQAQQYLLDSVAQYINSPGDAGRGVTATTDGGVVVDLITSYGEVQWKMDQTGVPTWCKQYGVSSERRAHMPDGGLVFSAFLEGQWAYDTTGARFQVVRTDALGDIVWSKVFRIHDHTPGEFEFFLHHLATDDAGRCLITNGTWGQSYEQFFYCLDADGNLLWSKTYQFNLAAGWTEHLNSDGMGGWHFGSYTQGHPIFRLGHLNPFGDLTWYNSYQWEEPPGAFFWLSDLTCLEHCAVAACHTAPLDNSVPGHSILMRLDMNGGLNWVRAFYGDQMQQEDLSGMGECEATEMGELLASNGYTGITDDIIRLSGAGEVIGSYRPTANNVAGATYGALLTDWDCFDSTLVMGAYLVMPWDSISPPIWRPAVWYLPIEEMGACSLEEELIFSVPLPNNNVVVTDQPFSELEVPTTITDTVCTVTSFTPIGVSDYCYFFSGIQPVQQTAPIGRVMSTLLALGDPISVMAPSARCGITVHDAHGRTLHRQLLAPNSAEQISTSGWAAGLYFVRFQAVDGGKPNVVKVVIE